MANIPLSRGAILTMHFIADRNRFACSLWYAIDSDGPTAVQKMQDLDQFAAGALLSAWLTVLAADCECVGYHIGGSPTADIRPERRTYPAGAKPGSVAGTDSTPPQTSMVVSWYSSDNMALQTRIRVAKSFIGPGPESKFQSGVISDATQFTDMETLATVMTSFNGAVSGGTWKRVGKYSGNPANELIVFDLPDARGELFTQKRRMVPLF